MGSQRASRIALVFLVVCVLAPLVRIENKSLHPDINERERNHETNKVLTVITKTYFE